MSLFVILHDIRSAHNVGSIFRTADGAGVVHIYLTGYTPAPIDRFGRKNKEIVKTSLGAIETVAYTTVQDVGQCIQRLKGNGVHIVAVEQTERADAYDTFIPQGDVAYVFGNEVLGVDPQVLALADTHVHIPMQGKKESLNVSVCAGIILFDAVRKS